MNLNSDIKTKFRIHQSSILTKVSGEVHHSKESKLIFLVKIFIIFLFILGEESEFPFITGDSTFETMSRTEQRQRNPDMTFHEILVGLIRDPYNGSL